MKIAVIGAGAIGGLAAGYLKLKNEQVSLAGNPDSVNAVKEKGLEVSGVRGNFNIKIDMSEQLNYEPQLAILAVKTQDIDTALKDNLRFLKNAVVLTAQNGIQADDIAAKYLPKENIVSSIIMFGATYLGEGKIVHNFEGKWIVARAGEVAEILNKIFPVVISDDILGMKWLKIFVNANNCLAAVLGKSMQETFKDLDICKISMRIWQEGLDIIKKCGIKLVSLPDFPLERLTKLTALPLEESAKIFSGIMTNLSKEPLYGSILQSIKRDRPSEIDYINGEFVNLARKNGLCAPLNERLVSLVHRVEESKNFLTQQELRENTRIGGA